MGRPSFTIDKQRLRDLRDEANKTQLHVAKELHVALGKNHPSTDATLERDYQRLERYGRTSRQRAEALARIFGVSVEVLQGKEDPEPFDYLKSLCLILADRVKAGDNDILNEAFLRESHNQEPRDKTLSRLAEKLGARIESVQLGRNPTELAELAELTGLSEREILKPAHVSGHWLVIANGLTEHQAVLIRGIYGLLFNIREIAATTLDICQSDASIRMLRDDPWIRLEIRPSRSHHEILRIDCVRCVPSNGTGLRWAKPTWRERFAIEEALRDWAYSAANFVTDFEGKKAPVGGVRRLRLQLTEFSSKTHRPSGTIILDGNLAEMPEQTFNGFSRESSTHWVVLRWLTEDLKRILSPILDEHPTNCWSVAGGDRVTIELDELKARGRPIQDCHFGIKYSLDLVEEIGENVYSPVPWRNKDRELFRQDVKNLLDHAGSFSDPETLQHRTFTPCVGDEP